MNSLNSVLLEGYLTRDPESKIIKKTTSLCTFSIASNRYFRMGEDMKKETFFFDVETWAGLADKCFYELKKGREVRVIGHLKQDRWTDSDGKEKSKVKIVADHVEFKPMRNKAAEELPI